MARTFYFIIGLFHEEAFVPELPKSGGTVAF